MFLQVGTTISISVVIQLHFSSLAQALCIKKPHKIKLFPPKGRVWRKRSDGMSLGCTSKGVKAGYNGRVAHFSVAISHMKGVISCEQYTDVLTGELFTTFVNGNFVDIFRSCKDPNSGMLLQDGDPRQNSKAAQTALQHLGMQCFSIPARSPDLNPIENLFHLVNNKLKTEVLEQNI